MKSIYAVVAMGATSGKFYTVTNFEIEGEAQTQAAHLREIPDVQVEVIETHLIAAL